LPYTEDTDPENLPGFLLRRCHQIAVGFFLDECEEFDLTPIQFAVLNVLDREGPQDQGTIGRAAALDRTTIAVVLKKLEERELVIRASSLKDKRAKVVSITKEGEQMIEKITPSLLKAQSRMLDAFSESERKEFLRLLNIFANHNNDLSRAPLIK